MVVKNGLVGLVKLKIPSRLQSEPWTITLEKVYIVVSLQNQEDYDEMQDDAVLQEIKLASLDGIESEWRAKHDNDSGATYYPSYSSWMSFGTSLIGSIIENIQIQICDVHIRYEDDSQHSLFSCGFSMESLRAISCDDQWIPKFVQRQPGNIMSFKLVELQNMAVYVNVGGQSYSKLAHDELLTKMSTSNRGSLTRNYDVFGPISANAMIRRNCSEKPLDSRKTPRISGEIDLGEIEVKISDQQYQACVHSVRAWQQFHRNQRYWRWRPREPVKGHAKSWWLYAITSHMQDIHEKNISSSWEKVLECARENIKYVEAFQSYLKNPVVVDEELRETKTRNDACRSYVELKILREIAVERLVKQSNPDPKSEEKDEAPAQSVLQSWFPLWWGWHETSPEGDENPQDLSTSFLEDELMEVLDKAPLSVTPYKDAVFCQLAVSIDKCLIKLERAFPQPSLLFDLEFDKTKMELETRPRTRSYKLVWSLEAMFIRDHSTENTVFPTLIAPQAPQNRGGTVSTFTDGLSQIARTLQSYVSSNKVAPPTPLFHLHYEKNPHSSVDHLLHISSQPLSIVCHPEIMEDLRQFFQVDDLDYYGNSTNSFSNAAYRRMEEVKAKTQQELNVWVEDSANWRKRWDLVLDLSAPQITIPEHLTSREASLLMLDFGRFHADNRATDRPSKGSTQASIPKVKVSAASDESDEESSDEFVTPASSPGLTTPPLSGDEGQGKDPPLRLEPDSVRQRLYETYFIQLCDLQLIVGRVKDNWKQAQLKGTSSLHVLDKFSISLQLDRLLAISTDEDLPRFAFSGTLPRLSLHVNEAKLRAMDRLCASIWGSSEHEASSTCDQSSQTHLSASHPPPKMAAGLDDSTSGLSSVLVLAYFCINELSMDVQSLGKSIVELQITGVKASLSHRPSDMNFSLSVHSLLLVDAMQTFGSNFELLAASHRNVSVDSMSGSLRGSDPASPASPHSPYPTSSPKQTSPSDIAKALAALQKNKVYLLIF